VIIEISGPEGVIKVNTLSSRLRKVIGENATVSRPVVKTDVQIWLEDGFNVCHKE